MPKLQIWTAWELATKACKQFAQAAEHPIGSERYGVLMDEVIDTLVDALVAAKRARKGE